MYNLPMYQLINHKLNKESNVTIIESEFLDDINDGIILYKTEDEITDDGYFYFQLSSHGYNTLECLRILHKAAELFECTIDDHQNITRKIYKPTSNNINEAIAATIQACTAVITLMSTSRT